MMVEITDEDKKRIVEVLQDVTDLIEVLYSEAVRTLREGITVGQANIPVGLRSLEMFGDLLHGGAYKTPITELEYYRPDIQKPIIFEQNTLQNGAIQFFIKTPLIIKLSNGKEIALPTGAKPEQVEIIVNSAGGAEYVLPKLLSDQEYYLQKEWDSLFNTTELVTRASTAVQTIVRTGAEAFKDVTGGGLAGLIEAQAAQTRAAIKK